MLEFLKSDLVFFVSFLNILLYAFVTLPLKALKTRSFPSFSKVLLFLSFKNLPVTIIDLTTHLRDILSITNHTVKFLFYQLQSHCKISMKERKFLKYIALIENKGNLLKRMLCIVYFLVCF